MEIELLREGELTMDGTLLFVVGATRIPPCGTMLLRLADDEWVEAPIRRVPWPDGTASIMIDVPRWCASVQASWRRSKVVDSDDGLERYEALCGGYCYVIDTTNEALAVEFPWPDRRLL